MNDVTRILAAVRQGDRRRRQLMPMFTMNSASSPRGDSPTRSPPDAPATALVHEAYLRLSVTRTRLDGRALFAARRAMRRILVERAAVSEG